MIMDNWTFVADEGQGRRGETGISIRRDQLLHATRQDDLILFARDLIHNQRVCD